MVRTNIIELEKAIRAVAPTLISVSIGRRDDKSTWKLQFSPRTPSDQIQAAQKVVEAFELKEITEEEMQKPSLERKERLAKADLSQLPKEMQPIFRDLIDEIIGATNEAEIRARLKLDDPVDA